MSRQSSTNGRAAVPIKTTKWPGPITDEHWRARTRLRGGEMAAAWAAFIGRVPWTQSWTLTFDPKRRFAVGQELASREVFSWLAQAARVQRRAIAWTYATERGASGLWHAHALTTATLDKVEEYLMMDWQLRNGHAHCARITDGVKATMYVTKAAALRGEVICSDTLIKYRDRLNDVSVAELWPER